MTIFFKTRLVKFHRRAPEIRTASRQGEKGNKIQENVGTFPR
jgi:hypothetical protein